MNGHSYGIRFDGTAATIKLVGEADMSAVAQLDEVGEMAFGQSGIDHIHVDCEGLTFCDSTTLSTLVRWQNRAADVGIKITFVSVPARLMKLLTITGLNDYFEVQKPADQPG